MSASATPALVGGVISPAERDAVVFLRANHADGAFDDCTGTLLSPRVLVTAKHCVTLVQPGEFVCSGAGTLKVDGQGAGLFGAKLDGSKLDIFRGTAPVGAAVAHVIATFATESNDACHDDVAAAVLDRAIQLDSYPPLRVARPTLIGEHVRLVGYGPTEHDQLIERRELDDVRVADVGRDDGVSNPNATTPPRSFVVGGASACFGDSGGPAFSMTTGALTGVYSRITGDCFAAESRNTYMLASSFFDLFSRAFQLAGETPQLEPAAESPELDPAGTLGSGGVGVAGTSGLNTTVADLGGAVATHGGSSGLGVISSGGLTVGATQSGEATADVATSATSGDERPVTSRHEALRCSIHREGTGRHNALLWLFIVLSGRIRSRRLGRRPSEGG